MDDRAARLIDVLTSSEPGRRCFAPPFKAFGCDVRDRFGEVTYYCETPDDASFLAECMNGAGGKKQEAE